MFAITVHCAFGSPQRPLFMHEAWNCNATFLIGGPRKTLYTNMEIAAHAIA